MTTPSDRSLRLSGGSIVRKHLAKNSQTAADCASSSSPIIVAAIYLVFSLADRLDAFICCLSAFFKVVAFPSSLKK